MTANRLIGCFLLSACSLPNGALWEQALPDGQYLATPIVCSSTKQKPLYRQPEQPVVLYDFTNLESSTFTLQNPMIWRTFTSGACQAVVKKEVSLNSEGEFAWRVGKEAVFSPEGCSLNIQYGDSEIAVNAQTSAFFGDGTKDDRTTDISFTVLKDEDGFLLRSVETEELHKIWESFGCGAEDTVEFRLLAQEREKAAS